MFPSFLCRKITGGGRIVAAVDMDKAEKKTGPVRIVGIVGEGSVSPLKSTPWLDVMLHTVSILQLRLLSSTRNLYTELSIF